MCGAKVASTSVGMPPSLFQLEVMYVFTSTCMLSGQTVYRSQLQYIQQLAQKRLATSHLHSCPPVPSPHTAVSLVAKSPGKLQGQCNGALNKPCHDQCISATAQAVVSVLGREESPSFAPGEDVNLLSVQGVR